MGTWVAALVLAGVLYLAYRIFLSSVPEAYRTGSFVQSEHGVIGTAPSINEPSVLPQPLATNAYPKGYPLEITQADKDVFDREKAAAIKLVATDMQNFMKEKSRVLTEDEFKNVIDQKYSATLGGEYYEQNLQYYDYAGDSGPPHFLLFYVLTQLRDYAFGHGSPGGCGFNGCVGYNFNQNDVALLSTTK